MQEEEDRELQEAFEATAFSLCKDDLDFPIEDHEIIRERMLSLGNVSAPPVLHRNFRFSSISGYSSLIEPHRRFSYNEKLRRQSTSESQSSRILSAYRMGDSFGTDDYFLESDGEEADDEFEQFTTTADIGQASNLLVVPGKVRKLGNVFAKSCQIDELTLFTGRSRVAPQQRHHLLQHREFLPRTTLLGRYTRSQFVRIGVAKSVASHQPRHNTDATLQPTWHPSDRTHSEDIAMSQ
jgi:hypothetical protein